jgi:hypothetical protein
MMNREMKEIMRKGNELEMLTSTNKLPLVRKE